MSDLSLVLPVIGQPDSSEDPKINSAFTAIQVWANGNIDLATNLSAATNTALALTPTAVVGGAQPGNLVPSQPNATRPVFVNMNLSMGGGATVQVAVANNEGMAGGVIVCYASGSGYTALAFWVPAAWYYELGVVSGTVSYFSNNYTVF